MIRSSYFRKRCGTLASRRAFRASTSRRLPEGPEVQSLVHKMDHHLGSSRFTLSYARIVSGRYKQHGPPSGWQTLVSMLPLRVKSVQCQGSKSCISTPVARLFWFASSVLSVLASIPPFVTIFFTGPLRVFHPAGKFIYFTLSNAITGEDSAFLWSTLGLSGGWTLSQHRQTRVILTLEPSPLEEETRDAAEDGKRSSDTSKQLCFYDQRNFGTIKLSFDR